MTKLEQKLNTELRRFGVGESSSLVVAVSGGADSISLLDACVRLSGRDKLPVKIFAAHLNHQLRGEESDGDEAFVRRLAVELGIECLIERIAVADFAKAEKRNLEATARRLRYEFLARAAESFRAEFVCTAHTLDDQAETILMRLLRGTGADGMRGIRLASPLGENAKLIRPMLAVTRAEVLEHCARYNLEFRRDSSNLSSELTRNRIRQELIPLLQSFNQRSNETLIRFAELVADDDDYLRQIALAALAEARIGDGLNAKFLKKLHPAIQRRVLRLWLEELRGSLLRIEAVHISALESLILREEGGRTIELPGGWQVRRKSGVLEITRVEKVL
ncbi:MAG: tRNA lysidine(34) synthetase TilS [Acidobacteriota bacterium]